MDSGSRASDDEMALGALLPRDCEVLSRFRVRWLIVGFPGQSFIGQLGSALGK